MSLTVEELDKILLRRPYVVRLNALSPDTVDISPEERNSLCQMARASIEQGERIKVLETAIGTVQVQLLSDDADKYSISAESVKRVRATLKAALFPVRKP